MAGTRQGSTTKAGQTFQIAGTSHPHPLTEPHLVSSSLPFPSPLTTTFSPSHPQFTSTLTTITTTTTPPTPFFVYGYYRSIGLAPLDLLFDSDTPIDIARPVALDYTVGFWRFPPFLSPLNRSRPDSHHPPRLYISILLDSHLSV